MGFKATSNIYKVWQS